MLWLWLLAGLLPACLCSGLYQATSVEAHGPLARLSLHHGLPLAHGHPALAHRLHHVFDERTIPSATHKQFYYVEQESTGRPVSSAVLKQHGYVLNHPVPHISVVPVGQHTAVQFCQPFMYPAYCYPVMSHRPLQDSIQHHPPPYYEIPQPTHQCPSTSQPPQQLPSVPNQPQQPPNLQNMPQQLPPNPQVPQNPVSTETHPTQQFPSLPRPSTPSPGEFSNAEFDFSDTVVVENPDFTRSSKQDEQSRQGQKNENSPDDYETALWNEQNAFIQKSVEQDRIIQNIINDFENLQLLRMSSTQHLPKTFMQRTKERPNNQIIVEPPKTATTSQQLGETRFKDNQYLQQPHESQLNETRKNEVLKPKNLFEPSSINSVNNSLPSLIPRDPSIFYKSYLNYLQGDQDTTATAVTKSDTSGILSSTRHDENDQRRLLGLLMGSEEVYKVAEAARGPSITAPCDQTRPDHLPSTLGQRVEPARTLHPLFY